jgi:predicted DNA-binding antitoxin AbrB/MazE fold protein
MDKKPHNFKKEIAVSLRKNGYSYSSISNQVHIPKSTVVLWLKKIKLNDSEKEKLKFRHQESIESMIRNKKNNKEESIEHIKNRSARDIDKISRRELWLMGIIFYWSQRLSNNHNSDLKKGINFTSSNPSSILFFLKWLKEIGNINNDEIIFDLFLDNRLKNNLNEIISFWSDTTNYGKEFFYRVYYKNKIKIIDNDNDKGKLHSKNYHLSPYGYLRIRVKKSSLLVRQVSGWIDGIMSHVGITLG